MKIDSLKLQVEFDFDNLISKFNLLVYFVSMIC